PGATSTTRPGSGGEENGKTTLGPVASAMARNGRSKALIPYATAILLREDEFPSEGLVTSSSKVRPRRRLAQFLRSGPVIRIRYIMDHLHPRRTACRRMPARYGAAASGTVPRNRARRANWSGRRGAASAARSKRARRRAKNGSGAGDSGARRRSTRR